MEKIDKSKTNFLNFHLIKQNMATVTTAQGFCLKDLDLFDVTESILVNAFSDEYYTAKNEPE